MRQMLPKQNPVEEITISSTNHRAATHTYEAMQFSFIYKESTTI